MFEYFNFIKFHNIYDLFFHFVLKDFYCFRKLYSIFYGNMFIFMFFMHFRLNLSRIFKCSAKNNSHKNILTDYKFAPSNNNKIEFS